MVEQVFMGVIRQLPTAVVNQIAAGEVIERPASVVKELLENSLDAGATRVAVTVEQGGRDLIRVWDNGCGIAPDDLPLAVAPHATSKLETADDLFRVRTFGFRGEALASIASVSQLRVQSRTPAAQAGAQVEVVEHAIGPVLPCGCPEGTTVEVRHLFYNAPVRRRFLKGAQTEIGHIVEAFTRVALAHPKLTMRLEHNEKTLSELAESAQLLERVAMFFGRELAEKLIWIESEHAGHRLAGFVADPSQSRSNARTQYFFVNGRYIRDRSLSHALSEAYRGLLMVGRYPIGFLFFETPPDEVDVNVHPTKLEVRFRDSHQLYSQLLATLRQKFLSTDLTASLVAPPPVAADDDADQAERVRQSLNDFLDRAVPPPRGIEPAGPHGPADSAREHAPAPFALRPPVEVARTPNLPWRPRPTAASTARVAGTPTAPIDQPPASPPEARPAPAPGQTPAGPEGTTPAAAGLSPVGTPAMQVHDSYLVVETADGLMVIDQHALHERVLYEELRGRVLAGKLESQRLLVPEMIELSAAETAVVSDHRDVLARLGMDVEPFGGTTIALHTYPAMLANLPADRMLRDIAGELAGGGAAPGRRDLLDALLHMIACKAAVKAGDRLTPEEIESLVAQQHLAQDSHHCPHGRPTALVLSKKDLERQFKRT